MNDTEIRKLADSYIERFWPEQPNMIQGRIGMAFRAGYYAALESIKNKVNKENKPTPEIPIDDLRYLNNLNK